MKNLTEGELVNRAIGSLLREGEYRATPLGLPLDRWVDLVRARCQAADIQVRVYDAACGCCASVVWDDWDGDHGPLREAADDLDAAKDDLCRAVEELEQRRLVLESRTRDIPFEEFLAHGEDDDA